MEQTTDTTTTTAAAITAFADLLATLDARAELLDVREALSGAENLLSAVQHAGDQWNQAEAHGPRIADITWNLCQSDTPSLLALGLLLDVYLIKQSGIAGTTADGVYQRLCETLTPVPAPTLQDVAAYASEFATASGDC